MNPLQLSSGDLIADRRADFAQMLAENGEAGPAADLLREALMRVPGWTGGWFRMGEFLEAAGRIEEATQAWREALRLDPHDRFGASLKLNLAGALAALDAPPSAFVETLFDQYAARFDTSLVTRLGYTVPERIAAALEGVSPEGFRHCIDLGCGTGLAGERLRARVSFMEGLDISAGMLRKAEAKRIYDRLERMDLQMLEPGPAVADLVVAADVFMYLGALDRVFPVIASRLLPGGAFAYSVEAHDGDEPFVLLPSRRFAHSRAYLEELMARHRMEPSVFQRAPIRSDRGAVIEGFVIVAHAASAPQVTGLSADDVVPARLVV